MWTCTLPANATAAGVTSVAIKIESLVLAAKTVNIAEDAGCTATTYYQYTRGGVTTPNPADELSTTAKTPTLKMGDVVTTTSDKDVTVTLGSGVQVEAGAVLTGTTITFTIRQPGTGSGTSTVSDAD